MDMFRLRRARAAAANNPAPAAAEHEPKQPYGDDKLNARPSFGQWAKGMWLDVLTMALMGALGLGLYFASPVSHHYFPVYSASGDVIYPDYAFPVLVDTLPIWLVAILASLVPIAVILIMQIRIKSFWDINNGITGLLYSLITAAVFQVWLKWLIGGLRPHFFEVCRPNLLEVGAKHGTGFGRIMYDRTICTGDEREINDALESFPSGHTTAAFAGFVYLYLYLNAKLKVWSNYHPAYWKLVLLYIPILGATLIGGILTINGFHNWYDVVVGAIIGTTFAFSAYRMVYASVWDFRFNHVPLTRHLPFTYDSAAVGFVSFHDAVWTRKAGWGAPGGGFAGGAPFDAAALLGSHSFNPAPPDAVHPALRGAGTGAAPGAQREIPVGDLGRPVPQGEQMV